MTSTASPFPAAQADQHIRQSNVRSIKCSGSYCYGERSIHMATVDAIGNLTGLDKAE